MPKNLIVCADGTGNMGGSTPDSNVYKMYKLTDKHFYGPTQDGVEISEQMTFYDNGVGTERNKYLRAVSGAFGFGFERNVCDLYKFLARNYEDGDRIFFFGFSRGASTVRACNGFIYRCGLAKGRHPNGDELHDHELEERVKEAFKAYKKYKKHPELAEALKKDPEKSHGDIPIHFIGVWDTVVALGFPKRTDITGPVSLFINVVFGLAEDLLDKTFWPHSFYDYRLNEKVHHAYQALAIDDERTAFWPFVWREHARKPESVEQVWFAGMHSNVGGGYPRSGMASVALYWMMLRARKWGMAFEEGALQKASDDSNAHGRMYDSRSGFGSFYRYHPREIENLCNERLLGNIRLHESAINRITHRTDNYAPGQIPKVFDVTGNDPDAAPITRKPGDNNSEWKRCRKLIDRWVLLRKGLYATMMIFSVSLLAVSFWLWTSEIGKSVHEGIRGHIADILDYFLPEFFEGLVEVAVMRHPEYGIAGVVAIGIYLYIRKCLRNKTVDACESLRHIIIEDWNARGKKGK